MKFLIPNYPDWQHYERLSETIYEGRAYTLIKYIAGYQLTCYELIQKTPEFGKGQIIAEQIPHNQIDHIIENLPEYLMENLL